MQAAAAQGAFLLSQYQRWLTGLADVHRGLEPAPGVKTAGWLVGHLVITGDFARKLCGLPPMAPKEWRPLFSPGTSPGRDVGAYPPMEDLVRRSMPCTGTWLPALPPPAWKYWPRPTHTSPRGERSPPPGASWSTS